MEKIDNPNWAYINTPGFFCSTVSSTPRDPGMQEFGIDASKLPRELLDACEDGCPPPGLPVWGVAVDVVLDTSNFKGYLRFKVVLFRKMSLMIWVVSFQYDCYLPVCMCFFLIGSTTFE